MQVAWNAYLSTLSHNAALDTTALLGVLDQASSLLVGWVPDQVADSLSGLSIALGGGKCAPPPPPGSRPPNLWDPPPPHLAPPAERVHGARFAFRVRRRHCAHVEVPTACSLIATPQLRDTQAKHVIWDTMRVPH